MKKPIDPCDVGVVEIRLDLDLPYKLRQEILLNYALLLHHLQSHDKPRQLLHCHEHACEFPLSQLTDYLKTVNA